MISFIGPQAMEIWIETSLPISSACTTISERLWWRTPAAASTARCLPSDRLDPVGTQTTDFFDYISYVCTVYVAADLCR